MSVAVVVLVVVGGFYVRLSQGPVSLDFMTGTVQSRINSGLRGMIMSLGGVVIERPPGEELPRFRLRDLVLSDENGAVIARAPRAAIGVDEGRLWSGTLVPKTLELIGPRIFVRRTLGGGFELGFGDAGTAVATPAVGTATQGADGKSDRQAAEGEIIPDVAGEALLKVLSGKPDETAAGIGTIEDIRVSGATITLRDEPNKAIWTAPQADLAFRRMPYGFVVVTTANVANGSQPGTWRIEMSASYRQEAKSFSISARIGDLVPANISAKIFALAQFARVKVPLSGHAEIEITQDGKLTKAAMEFAAAAGEVGLPEYVAQPIIVDEGSLHADYDAATGGILIRDSSLLVGGSRAELTGSLVPVRTPEGILSSIDINLTARNAAIDTQGTVVSPVMIDRVEFSGNTGIEKAELNIADFVIMSGNAGVRLRGKITGGERSPGLVLSGRVRDLSAEFLKKIWPPIIAPKTRNWVTNNVKKGRVTDGTIQLNMAPNVLADSRQAKSFPAGAMDIAFTMSDVTSTYYKDLPPITAESGKARLLDNDFTLEMNNAAITVPSGGKVNIAKGALLFTGLVSAETQSSYDLKGSAKAQHALEFLNLPALSLINSAGVDTSRIVSDATFDVKLKMPLIKEVPKERVVTTATAKLTNTTIKQALSDVDITNGSFELTFAKGELDAEGKAKLNGKDVDIAWHRDAGKGARQSAKIVTTLDDDDRKKIGIDLSDFLEGPIPVTANMADLGSKTAPIAIAANLSKVTMHVAPISWRRGPTAKTSAKFNFIPGGDGGRRVEDLEIDGPGVSIKGSIALKDDKGGMREANLKSVVLGDENAFAMKLKPTDKGTMISLSGKRFDARPIIRNMFSAGTGSGLSDKTPMLITANVERVYAFRGEEITGVNASLTSVGGVVKSADITGTFLSGQPIVLRIEQVEKGRRLQVTGRDAGAALRASNLYSKVAGGQLNFSALLTGDKRSTVKNGKLNIRDFEVRNEAALAELDQKGKPKKSGPRTGGIHFRSLNLPFTADDQFVRIGESLAKGPELGVLGSGIIRKQDSAVDIVGTIIPAYALNSAVGEIPILGDILTGGKGEGIIGITFALGGTFENPDFQVNPVSAIAPGFFRKIFEYQKSGTKSKPPGPTSNSNK
jgi:hypothetical protein